LGFEEENMPIYEFYCDNCHRIFSFFSRSVNTEKIPPCPKCGQDRMDRKVSRFAALSGNKKEGAEGPEGMPDLPIDENRMEQAMTALASEMEGMDENNPKAAAKFMQRFSSLTGLELNENMKEAMRRMEAGEDPEALEEEMGGMMEGDEMPFVLPGQSKGGAGKYTRPPSRDETLYEL
jgi:putative FmdB family regulatory protein